MNPPIAILVPIYGASAELRPCLDTLAEHVHSETEVLLLDDASLGSEIRELANGFLFRFPAWKYIRRPKNLGFVANCNSGLALVSNPKADILFLNSDTRVTAGFLEEMAAVLALDDAHAVVCPRSNNASIFSLPTDASLSPEESYDLWRRMQESLPRFGIMPTAVGFCMLIRRSVLDRFGAFDEIYNPGYNEENDFVCRVNREGWQAVVANHAYIFHLGRSSFGQRRIALEERNRKVLLERYPEYEWKIPEYYRYFRDPIEHLADLYQPHRPRILYDLLHLQPESSDEAGFALGLLALAAPRLEREHDVVLALTPPAKDFFAAQLTGYPFLDLHRSSTVFDFVFRPGPIASWGDFYRMNQRGARLGFVMPLRADLRSDYTSPAQRRMLQQDAAEFADVVWPAGALDAETCVRAISELLAAPIDPVRVRRRWAHLRLLDACGRIADHP